MWPLATTQIERAVEIESANTQPKPSVLRDGGADARARSPRPR